MFFSEPKVRNSWSLVGISACGLRSEQEKPNMLVSRPEMSEGEVRHSQGRMRGKKGRALSESSLFFFGHHRQPFYLF